MVISWAKLSFFFCSENYLNEFTHENECGYVESGCIEWKFNHGNLLKTNIWPNEMYPLNGINSNYNNPAPVDQSDCSIITLVFINYQN